MDGQVDKAVVQKCSGTCLVRLFSILIFAGLTRLDGLVDVPLELRGEAVGLKDGGVLRQLHRRFR